MTTRQQLPHLPLSLFFGMRITESSLLIYDLFNAATSEYIALHGRITDDDELERSWMERVVI
jgi:hypothetical protein